MEYRRTKENLWIVAVLLLGVLAFFLVVRIGRPAVEEHEQLGRSVQITEIMSANIYFPDEDGAYRDWVELTNNADQAVDLTGWGLSDRADEILYFFPEGTVIPAGGQLMVFCDKRCQRPEVAPFGISSQGDESVCLFRDDGLLTEEVPLPPLSDGESYVRNDDGTWSVCDAPTPGLPNDPRLGEQLRTQRETAETPVVISELMCANRITLPDGDGDYSDWIELWNTGAEPCVLSGWHLSDDRARPTRWEIPSLTLAPGERTVIFCSGKDRGGKELHTSFALSRDGGSLVLSSPEGAIAAAVSYPAMERDQVMRLTENSGWELSFAPTPGYPSTEAGREAWLAASDHPGALVINEAAPYNRGLVKDWYRNTYDWIELKNTSEEPLSLSGWSLTTDSRFPDMFPLPDRTLPAGGLLLIFCPGADGSRDTGHIYAPFRLSTEEERLFLYAPDGTLSDRMLIRDVPYGGSIGRLPEGTGSYYFSTPTPQKNNTAGFRRQAPLVTASAPQGIYNNVDSLIVMLSGQGEIHYTLNGSVPTKRSPVYTDPLVLTKTTVVRAVSLCDDKCNSDVSTFSYIINENHVLPVASIACDPVEFKKIYETSSRGDECEAEFVLFNGAETEFSHGCTLRLHGNTSRYARDQRPMVIEFNQRFGGDLHYDVFGTGEITTYSSLMLRGETVMFAYILRDSVAAVVAEQVSDTVLALDNRYSVLYVNGKYFGIYPIREDYSRQYVSSHTGSTLASCRVVKGPVKDYDAPDLCQILTDVSMMDMSVDANYEWAAQQLNMPAFADWLLLQGYFNNHDVGGNIRYITGDNTDGKWRPAFYDLDISMAGRNPGFQVALYGTDQINGVLISLMDSPQFRKLMTERAVILLDNGLAGDLTLSTINEFAELLEPEIPRETQRWVGTVDGWKQELSMIRIYFSEARTGLYINELSNILQLTEEEKAEVFGKYLP